MIDKLLPNSNYLVPYFKQFINIIRPDTILEYCNSFVIYNNLTSLGCKVIQKDDLRNERFDGIIINNMDYELTYNLMKNLYNVLNDNGGIFIMLHLKPINSCFDDDIIPDEINELNKNVENLFEITTELIGDSSWKFLIITKKHY